MSAIVTSTEVERPAADVFAYATDPTRFRDWQKGVVDGRMDGPADEAGSPTAGSKCLTTRRIGGANRLATAELVHIDSPRTCAATLPRDTCGEDAPSRPCNGTIRPAPAARLR